MGQKRSNWTPEMREAASKKAKANWTPERQEAMVQGFKAKWTPEMRAKASQNAKAKWTPALRAQARAAAKIRWEQMIEEKRSGGEGWRLPPPWTPERRAKESAKAKQRWEQLPEEERTKRLAKGRATWAMNFPQRAAALDAVDRPEHCGKPAGAVWNPDDEITGWKCWVCKETR